MGPRRLAGRADLLRGLLACREGGEDAHSGEGYGKSPGADRLAALLELFPQPKQEEIALEPEPASAGATANTAADESDRSEPLRPPLQARFFVVLKSERLGEAPAADEAKPPLKPLSVVDCKPEKDGEAPHTPLVISTRLWPALRHSLSRPHLGGVDLSALLRRLAAGEAVRRLPRQKIRNCSGSLVVVVDIAQRLLPYAADYRQLLAEVRRFHGDCGIDLWVVMDSPDNPLSLQRDFADERRAAEDEGDPGSKPARSQREARPRGPIPAPAPGTPVLILGDLGLLASDGRAESTRAEWTGFCRRLAQSGAHPVAWLPCSSALVSAAATRHARVHCLGDGDLRALAKRPEAPTLAQDALDPLLTRIACCVRVEPALLRGLRRMSPDTAAEPGLEGLLWGNSPRVQSGWRFCELGKAAQAHYRERFESLTDSEQAEVLRLIEEIHAYRGRSTFAAEALLWASHSREGARSAASEAVVTKARDWFDRFALDPESVGGDAVGYARDLLARHGGDRKWLAAHSAQLAPLWALTGDEEIPPGLDPADVARARQRAPKAVARRFDLVQRDEELYLVASRSKAVHRCLSGIEVEAGVEWSDWSSADGTLRRWVEPADDELRLPLAADPRAAYDLVAGGWRHRVALLAPPSWAIDFGCDAKGLYALAPSPLGEPVRLYWSEQADSAASADWPLDRRGFRAVEQSLENRLSSAEVSLGRKLTRALAGALSVRSSATVRLRLGADLAHGLYLDLSVSGATQRLRWIEPGSFLMGSPEGETGRDGDEDPQHRVTITRGFWIADTACAQDFWQAVSGKNPSRFKDDAQNPVENVDWDDVDRFLRALESLFPGCRAELPSEAEWEYACRAGTTSAFNFGERIAPEQANYNASVAYAGGPTGKQLGRTVPVERYAPNAWGLYQMHGNVWEWCADGMRKYDGKPQTDPRGPEGRNAPRVARGGSWRFDPGWLRSAWRSQGQLGLHNGLQGFRFSLRSTSQSGGAERPEE